MKRNILKRNIWFVIAKLIILTLLIKLTKSFDFSWLVQNQDQSSRLGTLSDLSILIIGIYAAIISIFATSSVPINYELKKHNRTAEFIIFMIIGAIETFALLVFISFVNPETTYFTNIIAIILSESLFSFITFCLMIGFICKYNINSCAEAQEQQNENINKTLAALEQIKIDLSRLKDKNN